MTWGKELKTLQEFARESGQIPLALRDRPQLQPLHRHYLDAFYEVGSGRSVGEFPQAITNAEILAYCDLFGIRSPTERELLFNRIRLLDATYLNETYRQMKEKQKK